jgi:pimeloyl-ACP methyl ester carboxylesterase
MMRIGGMSLHYQRVGKGPEVVLVHGLTGNLAFWYPTIVTGLAADYAVTALDLRGHGYSGMSLSGYTTRDLAGDLEALLDHLNIRCAHLMGHSYGGAIALHFAVLQPTRVASLTLADVRIRSLQPGQGVHEWPHWPGLRQQFADNGIDLPREGPNLDFRFLEALARRRLDGNVGHLTSGRFPLPFLFGNRQRAQQWLKLVGETTAAHDFQDTAGLTPEEIRKVVQPTLAITGNCPTVCLPYRRSARYCLTALPFWSKGQAIFILS